MPALYVIYDENDRVRMSTPDGISPIKGVTYAAIHSAEAIDFSPQGIDANVHKLAAMLLGAIAKEEQTSTG